MGNSISSTGLTTYTQAELITKFQDAMKAIYGNDINLDSDTPDGQMMMIFIQAVMDNLDLVKQVYNSFNPDNAIGVILDQRVAINGIQRQAGTYTITNITVVTSQAVTLYGLDQTAQDVYTVQDNAGTKWLLQETKTPSVAGTYVYSFRAENPGEVLTVPNTINVPSTIVLGVDSVNNPTTYTTLGLNEESDYDLKIRRQKSVSLSSQGYLSGLLASLEDINGIEDAFVYENNTGSANIDGVPAHSIWVVLNGTADDADIAKAIYEKRNAGCGMFGSESYMYEQIDGSFIEVKWDLVTFEDLYIQFTASSLNGVDGINAVGIKNYIAENLKPGVYEQLNINDLATLVQQYDNNCLVTIAGLSNLLAGPYTPKLTPSSKNKQFIVSTANISITVV